MSLNEGFSETFIFHVRQDVFKAVINFTKGMCTIYAPSGRILIRMEKLSQVKLRRIQKQINDYMEGKCNQLPDFNNKAHWGFRIV